MESYSDALPTEAHAADSTSDELPLEEKEAIYARAQRNARMQLGLYIHAMAFVVVMILLLVINLTTTPGTLWVVWPFGGWGLGLLVHAFAAGKLVRLYDEIKEREIVRQLELRKHT
jgi:hypothetical protein